jgi:hypothetical protein
MTGESEQSAIAGLAREVHALSRKVTALGGLPERVEDLARLSDSLTRTVKALSARGTPEPCPSWLVAAEDVDTVRELLDEICVWLGAVFLRYSDAASSFPDCWLWHPEVVEELLWLMHAWLAAYQGSGASVGLAGDWHERLRPGVVRRIRQYAGTCSRDNHRARPGWSSLDGVAPPVPGLDAVEDISEWWGARRPEAAPEPTPSKMQQVLDGRQ